MDELIRPLVRLFSNPEQLLVSLRVSAAYLFFGVVAGFWVGYGPGALDALWAGSQWFSGNRKLVAHRASGRTVFFRGRDFLVHLLGAAHLFKLFCVLRVMRVPADEAEIVCALVALLGVVLYLAMNRPAPE